MRLMVLWSVVLVASASFLLTTTARKISTDRIADAELALYGEQTTLVERAESLRSQLNATNTDNSQRETLAESSSHVVRATGLSTKILEGVSPEWQPLSRQDVPGAQQRRATLTLTSLTLHELGRLLERWRTMQPAWTISAIELSPVVGGDRPPGSHRFVRAILTVESITAAPAEVE